MEEQQTVPESTPSAAERTMAMVIDQTLRAPWVLLEVQRDTGDATAFGVKLHIGGGIEEMETVTALLRKVLEAAAPEVAPAPQATRIFTFGGGQCHPITGESLRDRYVEIVAESAEHCRVTMLNHWGNGWAFDYPTREKAGVDSFNLRPVPRDEWPPSSDRYYVDGMGCARVR